MKDFFDGLKNIGIGCTTIIFGIIIIICIAKFANTLMAYIHFE